LHCVMTSHLAVLTVLSLQNDPHSPQGKLPDLMGLPSMKQNGPTRSEGLHNVTSQMDLCHYGAS
jgi:hypothetical protein